MKIRTPILASLVLFLAGCCCSGKCAAPTLPAACTPSSAVTFERDSDGVWWATINGPTIIENTDGTTIELGAGESTRLRVSPEMAARLDRGEAP